MSKAVDAFRAPYGYYEGAEVRRTLSCLRRSGAKAILANCWRNDCAASFICLDRANKDGLQPVTGFAWSTVAVARTGRHALRSGVTLTRRAGRQSAQKSRRCEVSMNRIIELSNAEPARCRASNAMDAMNA